MLVNPYTARVHSFDYILVNPLLVRVYEKPGMSAPPTSPGTSGSKNTHRDILKSGQKLLIIGPPLVRV